MGQYYRCLCPTRAEWIDNYKIGSGLKAWEQIHGFTGHALALLIAAEPGNMPGDLASPVTGRWAGAPVALIGDYAEDADLAGWQWEPLSEVYGLCQQAEEDACNLTYTVQGEDQAETVRKIREGYHAQIAEIKAAGHRIYEEPFGRDLQGMIEYAHNVRFCGEGWLTAVPVRTVATARHAEDYKPGVMRVCTKPGWSSDKDRFEKAGFEKIGVYELVGYHRAAMAIDLVVSAGSVRSGVKDRWVETKGVDDETLAYYARCGIKVDDWHRPPRSGHWHGLRPQDIEEGQSRLIANLDKREFIDPVAFGETPTLAGIVSGETSGGSASTMLAMLVFNHRRGGGDVEGEGVGRWQGDRLLITAEHSRTEWPTTDEVRATFKNISYEATALAGALA